MTRVLGAAGVLFSGFLIYLQGDRTRLLLLQSAEELLSGLRRLESDIRSCHVELPYEFSQLGGFFAGVAVEQKKLLEKPLPQVFAAAAAALAEEERTIMIRFGKSLACDEESILSAASLAEKELEELIAVRRRKNGEQRRISAVLSFSGVCFFLLILL